MCKGWTALPAGKLAFIFFYFLHAQQHLEGTQLTTLCRLVLCSGATALAAITDLLYEITPGLLHAKADPHHTQHIPP